MWNLKSRSGIRALVKLSSNPLEYSVEFTSCQIDWVKGKKLSISDRCIRRYFLLNLIFFNFISDHWWVAGCRFNIFRVVVLDCLRLCSCMRM